jgi:uncharacterized membrane protein YqjE
MLQSLRDGILFMAMFIALGFIFFISLLVILCKDLYMRYFEYYTIIVLIVLILAVNLLGCVPKETKSENKYETIGKALGTLSGTKNENK